MEGKGVVSSASALVLIIALLGACTARHDEPSVAAPGVGQTVSDTFRIAGSSKPEWLDLYRSRKVVSVSTVEHVVMVTFQTLGRRDEVFSHYAGKFAHEENFSSFRDNRDIISFLREGYGVKITLLDTTKNLWSLEYHRQAI
ncbi:MAG: hypothetical protein HGB02_00240 [Chlorobiaceae bacterium]|nr:hypothetical protein [Chlorobiaceae bacterium]